MFKDASSPPRLGSELWARSLWLDTLEISSTQPGLIVAQRQGFPFRCVEEWGFSRQPYWPPWPEADHGRWTLQRGGAAWFHVPVHLIWPGFALNTLFYAAIAWGLWQVPLSIRRRHRLKHNRCPRCGYSLAGLEPAAPCPECGSGAAVSGSP